VNKQNSDCVDLAIVIVNWNSGEILRKCILSIVNNPPKGYTYGLFIVDNASTDKSIEEIKSISDVNLIENRENLGFAAGCNRGIENSQSKYILLLNPDTVVQKNTLTEIISFMDKHPMAGMAGGQLIYPDGTLQPSFGKLPSFRYHIFDALMLDRLFPKSKIFGDYKMTYLDFSQEHEVDSLVGAFIIIRRKVLEQIGILDEDIFMFCEDLDLAARVKKAGWKIYYTPNARVVHYHGESTNKARLRMAFHIHKSLYYFYIKHYYPDAGNFRRLLLISFFMFMALIKLPLILLVFWIKKYVFRQKEPKLVHKIQLEKTIG
jgi:hypothetical protein